MIGLLGPTSGVQAFGYGGISNLWQLPSDTSAETVMHNNALMQLHIVRQIKSTA